MRARERKRITEKFSKRILYRERKNMSTNQERMSGVVEIIEKKLEKTLYSLCSRSRSARGW